ncbi:hypothetical protein JOC95_002079 [Bacillus tianshenii]|uniref:DUF4340 domain-containing protein n=1 Tax=Sutcliffiella tianshenii TaxID=1463404 RepID=A0ABS2P021_9BACI|nr:hypothetical protein [Bacillus tianshenii]MBM7620226.1 hypothetical protein [Bacillus tianshenii]
MRKFHMIGIGLIFGLSATVFLLFFFEQRVIESIIFFPIDPNIMIKEADTSLELLNEKDDDEYVINWEVSSNTGDPVYLRQDISLLFADGRLKAVLSDWKDNSSELTQYATYSGEDSSHYVALSFHHGEIHHKDESITSTHKMSKDQLYVIDSSFSSLQSFKNAKTKEQIEWKDVLDKVTEQQLEYAWEKAIDFFEIPVQNYDLYSLEEIIDLQEKGMPGMDITRSKEIVGRLWEGLYKEYFLGIKTAAGTTIPPIDSSLPLILISKDYSHLLVLFETREGESVKLIQNLRIE